MDTLYWVDPAKVTIEYLYCQNKYYNLSSNTSKRHK